MYATTFENGKPITNYLAVGYAEGFEETDNNLDIIRAWSYICGTKLYLSLQGWFGRNCRSLIENGILQKDGTINWDQIQTDV